MVSTVPHDGSPLSPERLEEILLSGVQPTTPHLPVNDANPLVPKSSPMATLFQLQGDARQIEETPPSIPKPLESQLPVISYVSPYHHPESEGDDIAPQHGMASLGEASTSQPPDSYMVCKDYLAPSDSYAHAHCYR
jgi:hypothetical protein